MKFKKGQIVIGTAIWWDKETQKMKVKILNSDTIGFVDFNDLTIYDNLLTSTYFPKVASFILNCELEYKVVDVSEDKVFLSRKSLAEDLLKSSPIGTIRNGFVTGVSNNQIFVDIEGVSGLCILDEMAYSWIPTTNWIVEKGDYLSFYILGVNDNKLLLSRKRAFGSFKDVLDSYKIGNTYNAKVTSNKRKFNVNEGFVSYLVIVDNIAKGIIDVPKSMELETGDDILIKLLAKHEKGISGKFLKKC